MLAISAISADVDRLAFGEREFMGTSVSIYAHMKLKVKVVDRKNSNLWSMLDATQKR